MQDAIRDILGIADKLTSQLTQAELDQLVPLIKALQTPVTREDVEALVSLLPADGDDAFEVNWTILHAIESSPLWPIWDAIADPNNEWHLRLVHRLANAGVLHPNA